MRWTLHRRRELVPDLHPRVKETLVARYGGTGWESQNTILRCAAAPELSDELRIILCLSTFFRLAVCVSVHVGCFVSDEQGGGADEYWKHLQELARSRAVIPSAAATGLIIWEASWLVVRFCIPNSPHV
jgi:hypothetical protein